MTFARCATKEGKQLDTPAFVEDHLSRLQRQVSTLSNNLIPIVMAHHNILAQATPRVSAYAEVLNGGLVRSRLSNLGTPAIYCHGHIHDDPVETVEAASVAHGKLVLVSAPALWKSFNMLGIEFGFQGIPIV